MSIDRMPERMEGKEIRIHHSRRTSKRKQWFSVSYIFLYILLHMHIERRNIVCHINQTHTLDSAESDPIHSISRLRFFDFLYQHWANSSSAYRRQRSIVNITRRWWATHFRCGNTRRHLFAAGCRFLRESITVTDRQWTRHASHIIRNVFLLFVSKFI